MVRPKFRKIQSFDMPPRLRNAVTQARFSRPTDLQAQMIPLAMEGHDIICESRSGMGKSLCFALPILKHLHVNRISKALLICARDESIEQIAKVSLRLCKPMRIWQRKLTSDQQLGEPPREPYLIAHLDVAKPFVEQFRQWASKVTIVVIDEFDEIRKAGREKDVEAILGTLKKSCQKIISATRLSDEVMQAAKRLCGSDRVKFVKVETIESSWPEGHVTHEHLIVTPQTRVSKLARLLKTRQKLTYIATASDQSATRLARELQQRHQIDAHLLRYDSQAHDKQRILDQLAEKSSGYVVACDAAFRGLRMPHIPELINWELPKHLDDYWRRVDRLAQQGPVRSLIVVDDGHQIQVQVLQSRLDRPIPQVQPPEADEADVGHEPNKDELNESQANPATKEPREDRAPMPLYPKPVNRDKGSFGGFFKTLTSRFLADRRKR